MLGLILMLEQEKESLRRRNEELTDSGNYMARNVHKLEDEIQEIAHRLEDMGIDPRKVLRLNSERWRDIMTISKIDSMK